VLDANSLTHLHDESTRSWHSDRPATVTADPLSTLILAQHRANFDLWHQEDAARSPDAADSTIATVKHAIDAINQQRNDLVEQIDLALLAAAEPQNESAPLHSETPGLIIDRLSILALKIYHTAEETRRAAAAHRQRNLDRLEILTQQRTDLAACLDELWKQVLNGQRRFRLYRQLKMYNDPDLNPVLYGRTVEDS